MAHHCADELPTSDDAVFCLPPMHEPVEARTQVIDG
jgi:hypothetical protein